MIRLMALGTAIAMLGVVAVLVYAGVQRYRGRAISRATVRLAAGLEGASSAIGFIFIPEWFFVAVFLVLPAFAIYWLIRRGHRIAAGTLLLALGLPGALWWGFFLVQDAMDPLSLYDAGLWLWWAPEVVLIVVGAVLVAKGDRPAPERQLFERAASQVRDPAAIGSALLGSIMIGPIPIQMVVGMVPAMVGVTFGLPLVVRAGVPWPLALLAATALFAVVSTEVGFLAVPRRARAAMEGFAALGSPEMKRWLADTGTRVPTSVRAMRTWLNRNPDRPEIRWARAQTFIMVGDLDEARDAIERMPTPTATDRFEQHALSAYLEWVEGGDPDLEALQVEADTVDEPGSPERLAARGTVMVARARDLVVSGGDWMAPLIGVRDEAGPIAGRMLRADQRRAFYPVLLVVGFIICAAELWVAGLFG